MMGTWKSANPMLKNSISEVVEVITQALTAEKSANELCEILKDNFFHAKAPVEG